MQEENITKNEIEQHREIQTAALGAQIALQLSTGFIPGALLDATIALGRVAFETLCELEPSVTTSGILVGIKNEFDRLDKELATALEGGVR